MRIFGNGKAVPLFVEKDAFEGVRRIARKVAGDIKLVSGTEPLVLSEGGKEIRELILFATVGRSNLLEELESRGRIQTKVIEGKREVFGIRLLEGKHCLGDSEEFAGVEQALVIYGSDKRGTIYGMFRLSEMMGVSPLVFWGDAVPVHREVMELDGSVEMVSKEPSVRYRGFFINDEWPCFGKWTFHHYGGFTAEMYDQVFELLLRLKGNYLWPAMWTSSFALDGPGQANEELADIYGVIMGNSHHEPCLRASEEWDIYRGEDSIYGNAWNYVKNKEGLLHYWEDGLKRSGKFENIITIGMRGERDSTMEGPQTTEEHIALLKDIITEQKRLIRHCIKRENGDVPMLLAVYKEVEHYFYGEEGIPGLKDWDGLSDVILMFCEDNFGHMRYLPDERMRAHQGGFGMYYHLDYHGSPISYEWINSTRLTAIWEQMTLAYEYGIRDVWMVNVGDLKGNEFPLSYFMELAYDFGTWGSLAPNRTGKFTERWIETQFGSRITEKQKKKLTEILTEGTALIARRRPEALREDTYHPVHYGESDRVLEEIRCVTEKMTELEQELPGESLPAFYSMIYDDLRKGLNLICMQIYAGKNRHYARQGKKIANLYGEKTAECIAGDRSLVKQAMERMNGKWYGMGTGSHVGFRKWNEDGCRYPVRMYVEPFEKPRLTVSREDVERILVKNYGTCESMEIRDFLYAGNHEVRIEIANDGIGSFHCETEAEPCKWLRLEMADREIKNQEILRLICCRNELPEEEEICRVRISDGDASVELKVHGKKVRTEQVPKGTFFERNGVISVLAEHFAKKQTGTGQKAEGRIQILKDHGLCGSGIRAVPSDLNCGCEEGPSVSYLVMAEEEGIYTAEVWTAPCNPAAPGDRLCFAVRSMSSEESWKTVCTVPKGYRAGEPEDAFWSAGVVEQIHKARVPLFFRKGVNEVQLGFLNGILVVEKLLFYREGAALKKSCMGPEESWRK
ncbi:MAG: glycosyl hydrolase 115 family protein [Eubacteriales bacterium]|nr:glycosyl hydrolase 115 family protein [Eubacteriales bacterium]